MGIKIRYLAPVATGTAIAYSVERRADGTFFDFGLGIFRPLGDIPVHVAAWPLTCHGGVATAEFDHAKDDGIYIIRIHHDGFGGQIIAELPLNGQYEKGQCPTGEGGPHVEPHYRLGKKFIGNKVIAAKHRLTFHGDDGFTVHTATLWEDGTTSCNCTRWCWKPKGAKERTCPHAVRAMTLTANIDETGDQPDPPAPAAPQATNPFRRRSRSVDT